MFGPPRRAVRTPAPARGRSRGRSAGLLAVIVLLTAATVAVLIAISPEASRLVRRVAAVLTSAAPERAAPPPQLETGGAGSPDIRDVTPPGVTSGPAVTGPLVRVLPPPEQPKPSAKPRPRTERLFKPVVATAGRIETAKGTVALPGVLAPEPDETCGEGASAWPCGTMARAALARFIRGRAITCDIPAGGQTLADAERCDVGGEDIAGWLVAQGWARPDGEAHVEAAEAAKTAKRGIWSEARPR